MTGLPRRFRHSSFIAGITAFFACTAWFASGCVLLAGYYRVLSVETYLWYYAPLVLYGILLLLHFAADLMEAAAREAPANRSPDRQVLRFAVLLCLPLVAAFVLSASAVIVLRMKPSPRHCEERSAKQSTSPRGDKWIASLRSQ